jgi:hypothetical protein
MPVGLGNTPAHEPWLNGAVRNRSETQQFDEALETGTQLLAAFRLELAHKGLFKLGPVIGEAIANTDATLGQRNAGGQFGADGLAGHEATIEQPGETDGQGDFIQTQVGRQFDLGGSGPSQLEQDGVVTGLKSTFEQRQQQRLMRELPGFDKPVECGTG